MVIVVTVPSTVHVFMTVVVGVVIKGEVVFAVVFPVATDVMVELAIVDDMMGLLDGHLYTGESKGLYV